MDKDVLESWLADGRSLEWIGQRLGKHPSTVAYWVAKHGLEAAHRERHAAKGPIDEELLAELVERGLTVRQIAGEVERCPATVRHWLRAYGLTTKHARTRVASPGATPGRIAAECPVHGKTEFAVRSDGGTRCLKCRSEAVSSRRRRLKELMVEEAGGRCAICGYDRSHAALQFHHRDPTTKRFALAERGFTRSLAIVRAEARKCVLLCANCHAEVEAGVAKLPVSAVDYPS